MRTLLATIPLILLGAAPSAFADEAAPPPPADLDTLRAEIEALKKTVATQQGQIEVLESAAADAAAFDTESPPFRIYGWIDAGVQKSIAFGGNALYGTVTPSEATTFVLGNVNLYFDIQPIEKWSALVEIRLTSAPDGADFAGTPAAGGYHVTNTTITDATSPNGGWQRLRWGAIVLERAYLQYAVTDHLTLRLGTWLTPYGIWNVDHGLPTLISMMVPQGNVLEFLPPKQTGLQLLGQHHFGAWVVKYTGTISNGRNPARLDPTEGKAFGGRVVLERSGATRLALGASFYAGRYEEQERNLVAGINYTLDRRAVIAYDEVGGGGDISLDIGELRLRSEATYHHAVYDEGKRELVFGVPNVYWADRDDLDWYFLAAYRLPWLGLEPFALIDITFLPSFLGEGTAMPSVGCNIYFTAATQLKLQYAHLHFWGESLSRQDDVGLFAARAVVSF